jgi:hypothetical protein
MINIYLDDTREIPNNTWLLTKTPKDFMKLVFSHLWDINLISFDHDLWGGESIRLDEEWNTQRNKEINWWDLLIRTIETYKCYWLQFPNVILHTANPVWLERMRSILAINNLYNYELIW